MGILVTSSRVSFKMELATLWNCLCGSWTHAVEEQHLFLQEFFPLVWYENYRSGQGSLDLSASIEIKLLWLLGSSAWWILYAWKWLTLTFLPWASAVPYDSQRTNLLPDLKKVHSGIRGIGTTWLRAQYKYGGLKGSDCLFSVENKCSGIKSTLGPYPRLRPEKL